MSTLLFIIFWFLCAGIAYKMHQYWWTDSLDWTGQEALVTSILCGLFGPFHILISGLLLFFSWLSKKDFNKKVLKKARREY